MSHLISTPRSSPSFASTSTDTNALSADAETRQEYPQPPLFVHTRYCPLLGPLPYSLWTTHFCWTCYLNSFQTFPMADITRRHSRSRLLLYYRPHFPHFGSSSALARGLSPSGRCLMQRPDGQRLTDLHLLFLFLPFLYTLVFHPCLLNYSLELTIETCYFSGL
jgi:hypothetical protein